jgi:putative ABC transport system permease protein
VDDDFLGVMKTSLLVFSGVAMLVATFSIHNTFAVLIAQRTRESALLRAVGATRRQVVGLVTIESAFVGLVASALGVAAGLGLQPG